MIAFHVYYTANVECTHVNRGKFECGSLDNTGSLSRYDVDLFYTTVAGESMETSRALAVLFFLLLIITHGLADKYTITGCSSDGYIDVREDTGTTITCDGINWWDSNIYWALSGKKIGDCGDCSLTDPSNTDYQLSRLEASRSQLRIQGNFRPKALQNLTCSQRNNKTQVSCVINIIYPGNITLPAVFETDPVTWTAKSSYRVEKVYSSRNHYRCKWAQANERNIIIKNDTTDMERFNVSGNTYYSGTCSFSWTMPTTEGNYNYFGIFVPGFSEFIISVGTVKVEHPGDPEIHCVDRHVLKTGNLICRCRLSRTKPGIPAPSLSWPGYSNSSELTLVNVSHAQNGTQYTCKLTWGPSATIVRTANHTILLDVSNSDKYTITGCSSDGYIDVREDTGTSLTCDGIQNSQSNIYWALSGNRIGDCGQPCWLTDPNNTDYHVSRPNARRSQLTIQGNFRPKALQNLTCSQRNNNTKISCVINIIYPGNITLPAVFETDPVTWTAKSSYRVEKVYSSRNHYRCKWTQAKERNIIIKTDTTEMERFNVSGNTYYSGTCSFSWTMPTTEGNYNFFGIFVPGISEILISVGSIKVEHPEDPEIHCVDRHVLDTGNLTCQCRLSRTKPGIPAPSLSWPGYSNSSELTLVNVSHARNGTQYTCKLTWGPNATIVRTANHTILLDALPEEHEATQTGPAVPAAEIAGGVGVAIAVIIVAVIVVIVVVRRYRQSELSQDKGSISRNTDDEFEEHINSVYGMGDDREESVQKLTSSFEHVAEALTIPPGNTATGRSDHNSATDEGIMGPETEAEYSSIADDLASFRATEEYDQNTQDWYANTRQQTPSASANKGRENVEKEQDALYANFGRREVDIDNAVISQEDVYSAVDKSKRSSQNHNSVSSPNSTDQTRDKGLSIAVHMQLHKPSKMHDTDDASTPEGRDTELHQDTMTRTPTAAVKPAAKAKPFAKSKPSQQEVPSIAPEGPTGAGERIRTQDIRTARHSYENVGLSLAQTPLPTPPDSKETTNADEYNTLNLLNPRGARRQEPHPEYSHLSYL